MWRRSIMWLACMSMLAVTSLATGAGKQADGEEASRPSGETVVLLHGLARSSFSMNQLAQFLEDAGFATQNIDYPSTRIEAESLGRMLGEHLDACCRDAARVHFVTHSMGGIVVRAFLAQNELPNLGRVVMLAPPNHGSEWVDSLEDLAVFGWIMGPTAVELGTGPESLPNRLPAVDYPVGIIAGTAAANPIGGDLIPGDDDGTVAVESARLDGMSDFIELPASHSFIMFSDEVAQQVLAFLRSGHFDHAVDETESLESP